MAGSSVCLLSVDLGGIGNQSLPLPVLGNFRVVSRSVLWIWSCDLIDKCKCVPGGFFCVSLTLPTTVEA